MISASTVNVVADVVHGQAATEVFEKDCLIRLGTCVAPKGAGKQGKPCFSYSLGGPAPDQGEIAFGDLKRLTLGPDQEAELEVRPARGFDVGAGSGKSVKRTVRGGMVGLVLDGRGRPLAMPDDPAQCRRLVEECVTNMDLYPKEAAAR